MRNTQKNKEDYLHQLNSKNIFLLLLIIISSFQVKAQGASLFNLGEQVLSIAKSSTPEKILDYVNAGENLDNKAAILESFLATKNALESTTDMKEVSLFNVIKEKDSLVYFILKNNKKYFILKSSIDTQNKISNVFTLLKTDILNKLKKGEVVYKSRCYSCHGLSGKGGLLGPNLTDEYCKFHVKTDADLIDIIANGKKGTMMIAFKDYLTKEEIEDVALYLKSLRGIKVKNGKKAEGNSKNPNLTIFN